MGNFDKGMAIATGAKGFWIGRDGNPVTQAAALTALDTIMEDFKGSSAEFEEDFDMETPLSKLAAIAFGIAPHKIADADGWEEVQAKFSERYRLC